MRKSVKDILPSKALCHSGTLGRIICVLLISLIIFDINLVRPVLAQTVSPNRDIIFFNFYQNILINRPALFSDHPLLDVVILPVSWPEIEPSKGVFNFDSLDTIIDIWNKQAKGSC